MTEFGFEKIEEAKRNGKWFISENIDKELKIPLDLQNALMENNKALENFNNFAPSYQKMYIQ